MRETFTATPSHKPTKYLYMYPLRTALSTLLNEVFFKNRDFRIQGCQLSLLPVGRAGTQPPQMRRVNQKLIDGFLPIDRGGGVRGLRGGVKSLGQPLRPLPCCRVRQGLSWRRGTESSARHRLAPVFFLQSLDIHQYLVLALAKNPSLFFCQHLLFRHPTHDARGCQRCHRIVRKRAVGSDFSQLFVAVDFSKVVGFAPLKFGGTRKSIARWGLKRLDLLALLGQSPFAFLSTARSLSRSLLSAWRCWQGMCRAGKIRS